MFEALLEPLSPQLPPANVDVFGDATLRPAKRRRDELHETTDVDEESPASRQFKGEACAISGCPKDGWGASRRTISNMASDRYRGGK